MSTPPDFADLSKFNSHLERDTTALQNPNPAADVRLEDGKVIDDRAGLARVLMVQAGLAAAGYHCQQDGIYGRQTRDAVSAFQADRAGLRVTGVVDKSTMRLLAIATFS